MINKCLFLVAGLGTRFLPATKAMPKEMLPVLDKPLVQYGVEEAMAAGMTDICFVTGKHKRAIEDHFDDNFELDTHISGTPVEQSLNDIRELMQRCRFTYTRQPKLRGPGHAVMLGEVLTGQEPFGVVLADDLCLGSSRGALQQLVEVYQHYQCSVVAVQRVPKHLVNRYGIISGNRVSEGLYDVDSLVEKPSPEDAPTNLGIVGRYILTPSIFHALSKVRPGVSGEIQLTDAIDCLAGNERVLAYELEGKRFDCGSLEGVVAATNYCYQQRFGKLPSIED